MERNKLKKFLKVLGYQPLDGEVGFWFKKYNNHNDYQIIVKVNDNLRNSKIDWGNKIKIGRKSTSNFSQNETFVVFECVNRLLENGNKPESLVLEKEWKLGHKGKGFLDIQVLDESGKSFLMIECKTFGKEYDKAKNDTEKDGGQLFGYFIQERNTKYICLYSSIFENNKIKSFSDIIVVNKEIRGSENSRDAFDSWHPQIWESRGVFAVDGVKFRGIVKGNKENDLVDLTEKDGGNIYNRFAEILRKNVVSDKTNAFNKIFNLFLCKIVDEFETRKGNEYEFQWKDGESNEDVLMRLNDLYKRGMSRYLDLKIEAVSEKEFDEALENFEYNKSKIEKLFIRQKLYSGNEFAFKEVFDKESFNENCFVVREVVKLLEKYRIKYTTKQQFLGDFFERLLNTGIKQESGQYFTPTPIASFICKSIPFKKIIEDKNKREKPYFLPYIIDYASGAGHFLTEAMEEVDHHIKDIDGDWVLCGEKHKKEFLKNKDNFDWASEYIYGIEKDYRLAKTTKISTFLNGDGDANVIRGDGLDSFEKSDVYKGKLKEFNFENENRKFDILVANPPYSVDGFKTTLRDGKDSFELYPYLTDQSSEIECLFIERAKQLLTEGGIAGIILPSSILTNTRIYSKTREIIFKYFNIIGITELGRNTFMKTPTTTVVLFLKRKNNKDFDGIFKKVKQSFDNQKDITINGIEKAYSKYLSYVWRDEDSQVNFADYKTLINKNPNKKIKNHEIFQEYEKKIKAKDKQEKWQKIHDLEKEKITYFLNVYNQKVVLIKTGEKKEEKKFLGYEFSDRRGGEGIHSLQRGEDISKCTQLFDAKNLYNSEKASTYILEALEGKKERKIPEKLKENISRVDLIDMMTFDRIDFEKSINLNVKKKIKIKSKWDFVKLETVLFEQPKSKIKVKTVNDTENGIYNFFTSGESILNFNKFLVDGKNIYLSTGGNAIIKFFDGKASYSTDTFVIQSKNENLIKTKLIFYFIEYIIKDIDKFYFKGQGLRHLQKSDFREIKIPLPPIEIQQKIVDVIESLEKKENEIKRSIKVMRQEISKIINNISGEEKTLESICEDIFAGGDKPEKFSYEKTEELNIPIYANAVKNNGLYGYTNVYRVNKPSVTVSARGTIGFPIARNEKFYPIVRLIVIISGERLKNKYLEIVLKNANIVSSGTNIPQLTVPMVQNMKVPFLPFSKQQKIVSQIEKIENKISKLEKELEEVPKKKEKILKKYL